MIKLSNVRIGTKLAVMSGLSILLVIAMVGIQFYGSGLIQESNTASLAQQKIVQAVLQLQTEMRVAQVNNRDLLLTKSVEDANKMTSLQNEHFGKTKEAIGAAMSMFRTPANKETMQATIPLFDNYIAQFQKTSEAKKESLGKVLSSAEQATKSAEALDYALGQARTLMGEILKNLTTIKNRAAENAEKGVIAAEATSTQMTQLSTAAGIVAVAILVGSVFFGILAIARPLRQLVGPLDRIASGDFKVAIPGIGRKDEVGQISSAVGTMAQRVSATILEIKASGREVTNASAEISVATTDLSQRTEEQAASLEETSAAMEELSATVKKNAENAQQASVSALSTQDVAARGGEVVSQAVDAMSRIEDSSRKISDIIGVIDEIARQTNLLALNAAVEAARAGEAGRGFAVVASEVRSLAQRSSQAAKDIKDLITNSNGQVQEGVELVNRAGESLHEIVASIKNVATIVSDIANASIEQATGLEQINKALSQMDEVTQQNSALVEENAATAKTLEHQAKAMDDQVAFFQIDEHAEIKTAVGDGITRTASRPAAPRPAPVRVSKPAAIDPEVAQRAVAGRRGGPVGRMHANLATAVKDEWQEF